MPTATTRPLAGARPSWGPSAPPTPRSTSFAAAGGGAVGAARLGAARDARALSRSAGGLNWRLLAGANLSADAYRRLSDGAPDGVIVEPARADFANLLANCAVSVSQGGYNTIVDVLAASAPAVIVPFARGGETEQSLRAERLEAFGLVRTLDERGLTPARLAAAVDAALDGPRPPGGALATDGAERGAALIAGWAECADG